LSSNSVSRDVQRANWSWRQSREQRRGLGRHGARPVEPDAVLLVERLDHRHRAGLVAPDEVLAEARQGIFRARAAERVEDPDAMKHLADHSVSE
jgi:hypothetical protein